MSRPTRILAGSRPFEMRAEDPQDWLGEQRQPSMSTTRPCSAPSPRCLSREEDARYVGLVTTKFDELVELGWVEAGCR
jgi:hypothetical protein